MKVVWDPEQYRRFEAERARPFRDLVSQIHLPSATRIADLGCGDGSTTAELAERWPSALVEGVDSSEAMIEQARGRETAQLGFCLGDLREWEPDSPVDVLVSNATLQWVPGHLELLGRLTKFVRPCGVLAFQVPANFSAPSHTLVADLCKTSPWREKLAGRELPAPASHEPAEYLEALVALGLDARVWETTYHQVLGGPDAVLEWMKGTALRPLLGALEPADAEEFLAELGRRFDDAYPPKPYGTVLPFRRIFVVATVPGDRNSESRPAVAALDHVQLAMPPGREEEARGFYAGVLGLAERPKPETLAARGGCWFKGHRSEVHLGTQEDFKPATKAHVALAISGIDAMAERIAAAGYRVTWDDELAPRRRFYTDDPFGNRIELLEELG